MADLTPAAQAVLTAQAKECCLFEWSTVNDPPCHPSDASWNGCVQCIDRRGIAAALRAVADQVVPEEPPHPLANSAEAEKFGTPEEWMHEGIERDARQEIRCRLLIIAAELEGEGND